MSVVRLLIAIQLARGVAWEPDLWGRVRKQVESHVAVAQASAADLANVQR